MNDTLNKISLMGVAPVVVLDDAKDAVPLAKAMKEGGLPCYEVTLRTDAALDSILRLLSTASSMTSQCFRAALLLPRS